jgi:hypothetical protein
MILGISWKFLKKVSRGFKGFPWGSYPIHSSGGTTRSLIGFRKIYPTKKSEGDPDLKK